MKITNEDICKELNKQYSGDWRLCFDHTNQPFFSAIDGKCNGIIKLPVVWRVEVNKQQVADVFTKINWAKVYRDSVIVHAKNNDGKWEHRKKYISYNRKTSYEMILPKTVERILIKKIEKTKSSRDDRSK